MSGNFDWADDGIIDISGTSPEEFLSKFKLLTQDELDDIIANLRSEVATLKQRQQAYDFLAKVGETVIRLGLLA